MIALTPETESQLQVIAAQRGVSAEEAVRQIIAEAAEVADALAGLQQGTSEIAAGDWLSLEDLRHDLDTQALARRTKSEGRRAHAE